MYHKPLLIWCSGFKKSLIKFFLEALPLVFFALFLKLSVEIVLSIRLLGL